MTLQSLLSVTASCINTAHSENIGHAGIPIHQHSKTRCAKTFCFVRDERIVRFAPSVTQSFPHCDPVHEHYLCQNGSKQKVERENGSSSRFCVYTQRLSLMNITMSTPILAIATEIDKIYRFALGHLGYQRANVRIGRVISW